MRFQITKRIQILPLFFPLLLLACAAATAPPRTVSRVQPCVATEWKILLRPDVDEGRNNVLKRSWCAVQRLSPLIVCSALRG